MASRIQTTRPFAPPAVHAIKVEALLNIAPAKNLATRLLMRPNKVRVSGKNVKYIEIESYWLPVRKYARMWV